MGYGRKFAKRRDGRRGPLTVQEQTAERLEHAFQFSPLLGWHVTPVEARSIQRELAGRVEPRDVVGLNAIAAVAGVDNAYSTVGGQPMARGVVVALTSPALEVIATALAWEPVTLPSVPGLPSFRVGPAVLSACAQLPVEPDVVLFDGQGYAHPRRCGFASHLGVILDRPAIGCAKSRLVGTYDEPERVFGAHTPLVDRGEVVGAAVRTRPQSRHKPHFVSPGHKVSVSSAVAITLACCREGNFLLEPTRLAHEMVTWERRTRNGGR